MRLLAYVAMLCGACHPDDDDIAAFIATWEYGPDSTLTTDCNENAAQTTLELTGTFEIVAGSRSDLLTGMTSQCPIGLTIFDRTAVALPGQTWDTGPPTNARIALDGATFALGESDATLTFRTFTRTALEERTCTTSTSGTAVKRP